MFLPRNNLAWAHNESSCDCETFSPIWKINEVADSQARDGMEKS